MHDIKSHIISVVCAAIITALAGNMLDKKGAAGSIGKLISGIFLVFTLLSPLPALDLSGLSVLTENIYQDAEVAAALGESMADESLKSYIKEEAEAYILDKATELHAHVEVTLSLDSENKPDSVILTGAISPYAKFRLTSILEEDLGITKENQQWNES